jgi:hypothetical protein
MKMLSNPHLGALVAKLSACLCLLAGMTGCATYTGIPAHGGGKRFAVEQELVAASARAALKNIKLPIDRDKEISIVIVMIGDEGGGASYSNRGLNFSLQNINSKVSQAMGGVNHNYNATLGLGGANQNPSYASFSTPYSNPADSNFFKTLVSISLIQRGFKIVAAETADYQLMLVVDVFGTIYQRGDFQAVNSETLNAITKFEYSVIDMRTRMLAAAPEVLSYKAMYKERYIAWNGPVSTQMSVDTAEPLMVDFRSIAVVQTDQDIAKAEAARQPPPAAVLPPTQQPTPGATNPAVINNVQPPARPLRPAQ